MKRKIDRLDNYMKHKCLNDNILTEKCGLSIGLLGKNRRPGNDLSLKTIEKILHFYPDLNKRYLVDGEGEMIKMAETDHPTMANDAKTPYVSLQKNELSLQELFDTIASHARTIENLSSVNKQLVEQLRKYI